MSEDAGARRAAWYPWAGPGLLAVGLVAVGVSFAAPTKSLQTVGWTEEQAVAHQAAAAELHRLSYAPATNTAAADARRSAEKAFRELDRRLIEASEAPYRWRALLRYGGILLCVAGAFAVIAFPV
ncbi:MAG: hypothetical protein AAFV43_02345 [Planctomycetota bacterium]